MWVAEMRLWRHAEADPVVLVCIAVCLGLGLFTLWLLSQHMGRRP